MIPITQLLTASTAAQVRSNVVQGLVGLGIRADLWKKGGSLSTFLTVFSTIYSGFTQLIVATLQAGFLPEASGAWLVLLAYYVYGVTVPPATFPTGILNLTNAGGGIYTFAARKCLFANKKSPNVLYTNTAPFSLGPATSVGATQLSIAIESTTIGTAGNANPGDVSILVSSMPGVTASNPAAVLGQDTLSDPDIRTLCTEKLATLSVRGPTNAYDYAARTAVNSLGQLVNINRTQTSPSSSTGQVTVWCAAPSGQPTADDLASARANIIATVRPQAVTLTLLAALQINYVANLTVWVKNFAGLDLVAMQTAVNAAISNCFATYAVGGVALDYLTGFFGSALESAIATAVANSGSVVLDVEQVGTSGTPPPDLALQPGQVAANAVTATVRGVG